MLDPRLLRAFVSIADTGSFTLAAERLYMTQSTISQQLGRLEQAVGRELIDRAARPVQATASGERLLGYARRILSLQQEAETLLSDPAGTAAIRIGLPDDIVTTRMSKTFATFSEQHREVRLDVTTGLSRDLPNASGPENSTLLSLRSQLPVPITTGRFQKQSAGLKVRTFPASGQIPSRSSHFHLAASIVTLCSKGSNANGAAGTSRLPVAVCTAFSLRSKPDWVYRFCRLAQSPIIVSSHIPGSGWSPLWWFRSTPGKRTDKLGSLLSSCPQFWQNVS